MNDDDMSTVDYEKFYKIFYKYGSTPSLKVDYENLYVHSLSQSSSQVYTARQYVDLEAKFSLDMFKLFMEEINQSTDIIKKEHEEEYLRSINSAAKTSYEEYQLILKLIK